MLLKRLVEEVLDFSVRSRRKGTASAGMMEGGPLWPLFRTGEDSASPSSEES